MVKSAPTVLVDREWKASQFDRPEPPDYEGGPPSGKTSKWTEISAGAEGSPEITAMQLRDTLNTIVETHLPGIIHGIGLGLSLEEAITNMQRYGIPSAEEGKEPEPLDFNLLRVRALVERLLSDGNRHQISTTLSFFDQGPDLPETPRVLADRSISDIGMDSTHGRGFRLMLELGHFQVVEERISARSKVIRLVHTAWVPPLPAPAAVQAPIDEPQPIQ